MRGISPHSIVFLSVCVRSLQSEALCKFCRLMILSSMVGPKTSFVFWDLVVNHEAKLLNAL